MHGISCRLGGRGRKKRKKELRRYVTRKQTSAFTTKGARMRLGISQQRIDWEYLCNRIALGNCLRKDPAEMRLLSS